jgi:hypothetical protein
MSMQPISQFNIGFDNRSIKKLDFKVKLIKNAARFNVESRF